MFIQLGCEQPDPTLLGIPEGSQAPRCWGFPIGLDAEVLWDLDSQLWGRSSDGNDLTVE